MNILADLYNLNIKYEFQNYEKVLTFMDAEENLGVVLEFDKFNIFYHFWDANGGTYSQVRPFINVAEMMTQFDKLILAYYPDEINLEYFKDWVAMEFDNK